MNTSDVNASFYTAKDNSNEQVSNNFPYITLITGKPWIPSEDLIMKWIALYPTIDDIHDELNRMEEWFQKHPDRRKTERGMHSFAVAWLARESQLKSYIIGIRKRSNDSFYRCEMMSN